MSGFASARGDANAGIVNRLNSATASNAANYLTMPTPDRLGQMVHPDVWDFGTAWNGWRYWLAITPYSNTDATTENPCILVSNDKTTWSIPSGGSNPIDPAPGGGRYNSDADLWYEGGTLYCFWRSTGGNDRIHYRTSTDGVTWSAATTILDVAHNACISPAWYKIGATYYMIHIDATGAPNNTINVRTCSTLTGTYSSPTVAGTTPYLTTGDQFWHLNVCQDSDALYMILTSVNYQLYLASSVNSGYFWTIPPSPILPKLPGTWQANLYRSCILRTATGFDLWYSAHNGGNPASWRTAYTTVVMP